MTANHTYLANQIIVDPQRESYRGLYGEPLAEAIASAVADVPLLANPASNLLLQWRGVSYAVEFPASLVDHMSAFAGSFIAQQSPHSNILKLADVVLARCTSALPELTSDASLARKLHAVVVDLAARIPDVSSADAYVSSADEWWAEYIKEHAFRITLWSSLRVGYMAAFNAYETFIAQCVQQVAGVRDLRGGGKPFKDQLKLHLGESLTQRCWHAPDIHTVRQVRHSLSHAGGRVTDALRNVRHGVHVHDDVLQIMPADIRRAYETLARAAIDLITTVGNAPGQSGSTVDGSPQ